jgi:valyl-tRNA synthetase
MIYLAPMGTDVRLDVDESSQDIPSMEIGRNFANKVWNACRFLQMKTAELKQFSIGGDKPEAQEEFRMDAADIWIESRYHSTVLQATQALAAYRLTEYARTLYDFIWRDFCDWYVEIIKVQFFDATEEAQRSSLLRHAFSIIEGILKLLHPVMPFITEELWHGLYGKDQSQSISTEAAPTSDESKIDKKTEQQFEITQSLVEAIRRQRAEMAIPPGKLLPVTIRADKELVPLLQSLSRPISSLARCSELVIGTDSVKPSGSVADVVRGIEFYLVVEGSVDLGKERERLEKELQRLASAIGGVERKLSNEGFIRGAKPEVVETEKKKLSDWMDAKQKIEKNLSSL